MYKCTLPSPLGPLTLLSDGAALTGLRLPAQPQLSSLTAAEPANTLPVFQDTAQWLERYFSGQQPGPLPPLCPAGTPFQTHLWSLLLEIPYGQSVTYGQLSQELRRRGISSSPQAVGGAASRNPILLLIPCHRVLGQGGSLTGYAGGRSAKEWLLRLESIPFQSPVPTALSLQSKADS